MAIKTYFGVAANSACSPKKIYIGNSDETAAKILKIYAGDKNNYARLVYLPNTIPDDSGGEIECSHNWEYVGDWEPEYCTEEGIDYYRCSICGAENAINNGSYGSTHLSLQHEDYPAEDCTMTGSHREYCNSCGWEIYESTGSGPHIFNMHDSYRDPTCTTPGGWKYECSACGAISSDYDDSVPALGHEFDTEVDRWYDDAALPCTTTTFIVYECSRCGEQQTFTTVLGHNYEDVTFGSMPPTGYGKKCSRCGDEIVEHSHDWELIGADEMYSHYRCKTCGEEEIGY